MSRRKLRSEFIISEPPKERVRRRFRKVWLLAAVVIIGIGSCSLMNYTNQVLGQQIDIASKSISTLHRLQMSKQARLNGMMKYDDIVRKVEPLGFVGSTSITQVLSAPTDEFDRSKTAIFNKHMHSEHENFVSLMTQRSTKPVNDHN